MSKGDMLLISADACIEEISVKEFNTTEINSIKKRYGHLRQRSKAP